jgi:alpha-L-rhamnosidase
MLSNQLYSQLSTSEPMMLDTFSRTDLAAWRGPAIDPMPAGAAADLVWTDIPLWRACLSRRREFRDVRDVDYTPDPFQGPEECAGPEATGLEALPRGGEATVTADCMLRFDFGVNFTGSFAVEMALPNGTQTRVATGEAAEPLRIYPLERVGGDRYEPQIAARGFTALRFAWLRFEGVTAPVRIRRVVGRLRHCPLPYLGSFSCSDPLLERVWNFCAYSARLCIDPEFEQNGDQGTGLEALAKQQIERKQVDGHAASRTVFPAVAFDRVDRFPWAGDSRFIQLAVLHAFGAYERCRQAYDYFWPAGSEAWEEFNFACVPYMLDWGLAVLKFAEYTGDRAELAQRLPQLRQIVERGRHEIPEGWLFFDWDPRITTSACNAGSNGTAVNEPQAQAAFVAKYIELAREAARVFSLFGNADEAAWFRAAADARAAGCLAARPEWPERLDIHALTNAILAGLGDAGEQAKVYARVFADPIRRCTGTPYFGHSVLRALARLGRHDDAIDMLRRYWGGMIGLGATTVWEEFELDWTLAPNAMPPQPFGWGALSLCQPAGSGPVEWLHTELLGVKPLAPGFAKVAIRPHLGDLDWAEGIVPTPLGPLRVRLEKAGDRTRMEFSAPPGMEVVPAGADGADLDI